MGLEFPSIEPTGRSWDFGTFALSRSDAFAGSSMRFNHSSTAYGQGLTLTFSDLEDADAELIRLHYADFEGGYRSFFLPAITLQGHGDPEDIVPDTFRWIYAGPPGEDSKPGGFYDLTVELRCVGPELGGVLPP